MNEGALGGRSGRSLPVTEIKLFGGFLQQLKIF